MKFFIFFLFFMGFAFNANAQMVLTEANNDTSIIMLQPAKGTDFTVTLKNNGGTPYKWKQVANNDNVLLLDKTEERSEYKPKADEPPMTGTPYFTDFKFKFTGEAGTARLKFDLVSFSGDVAQSVNYMIKIKTDTRPVPNPKTEKPTKKSKKKKK
jgi:predicted secreted protein